MNPRLLPPLVLLVLVCIPWSSPADPPRSVADGIWMKLVNGARPTQQQIRNHLLETGATGGVVQVNWDAALTPDGAYDLKKVKADVLALDAMGLKAVLLLNTSAKKTPRSVFQIPGVRTIRLYDAKYPTNPPIEVPDFADKRYRTELSKFAQALIHEFAGSKNVVGLVIGFGTKYPEPNLTLGASNTVLVNHNGSIQNQSDAWASLGLTPENYARLLIDFATELQQGLPSVVQIRFPFHMTASGFLGYANRFQFVRLMFRPIVAAPIGRLAVAQLSNLSPHTPTEEEARSNPICVDESRGKSCGELLLPRKLGLPIGFEFVSPINRRGRPQQESEREFARSLRAAMSYKPRYVNVYPRDFEDRENRRLLLELSRRLRGRS
jgi:hypothetical protein